MILKILLMINEILWGSGDIFVTFNYFFYMCIKYVNAFGLKERQFWSNKMSFFPSPNNQLKAIFNKILCLMSTHFYKANPAFLSLF